MPRNYIKKEYPERPCLVCGTIFRPVRENNLYCSYGSVESCLSQMVTRERSVTILHVKAVVRQAYRCWKCDENLAQIGVPVFLNPYKDSPNDEVNIVAGCPACRHEHYLDIANLDTLATIDAASATSATPTQ